MRHAGKKLIWVMAGLAAGTEAYGLAAELSGHPFQAIVAGNVFQLKPPPAAAQPREEPKPPLPPMALTGIIDFGKLLALVEVVLPVKPPEQSKKSCFTLAQGEHEGELEVLKIDPKAGSVLVKLLGTVTNLTFASNGVRTAGPAAAGGAGAVAPSPVTSLPPSTAQFQPQLNRDETALVVEVERERLRQAGDPRANLMPPTHLTPGREPGVRP